MLAAEPSLEGGMAPGPEAGPGPGPGPAAAAEGRPGSLPGVGLNPALQGPGMRRRDTTLQGSLLAVPNLPMGGRRRTQMR